MLSVSNVLPIVDNSAFSSNQVIREGIRQLVARLPPGWGADLVGRGAPAAVGQATAEIRGPDDRRAMLTIEARSRITPKGASDVVRRSKEEKQSLPVVVANFISVGTRQILRDAGVNYIDLTGNIRLVLSSPGLFIETVGASENPVKEERSGSLKGAKAGRVVRALIENARPLGVRELAATAGVDAGYISRLFSFLDEEALITRVGRGRIEGVAWPKLLERWAADAPLAARARVTTYIEPRGLPVLLDKLRATTKRYAITGSFAAARVAPIAPTRLLSVYVDDVHALVDDTGLRPTDAGANVQLIEPVDDDVLRQRTEKDGVQYARLPYVVIDLLDGPGRAPAEAVALIEWMKANDGLWRG